MKIKISFIFVLFLFFSIPLFAFDSLQEAVSSDIEIKQYDFNGTELIENDLGTLKGNSLTINGKNDSNNIFESSKKKGIYLQKQQLLNINYAGFNNFQSSYDYNGGAIYNDKGSLTVQYSTFTSNSCNYYGGAILNKGNALFDNVLFKENSGRYGGAFMNDNECEAIMKNVIFSSNIARNNDYESNNYLGGAIMNKGKLTIDEYSLFDNNKGTSNKIQRNGGAVANIANLEIYGFTEFIQNVADKGAGGAIYNYVEKKLSKKAIVVISSGANFTKNSAVNGGAIYNDNSEGTNISGAAITLIANNHDINFTSNTATEKGGAIYNNRGMINLIADTNNIEFTGNTANGVSNAIHDNDGIINLLAGNNKNIIFNDRITSEDDTSVLNINPIIADVKDSSGTGNIILNEDMSAWTGKVNLYNGNLEITEGRNFFNGNFTIYGGTLKVNANSFITDFTNNGTVNLTGGTIGSEITGTGTTVINGQVTNSSTVANSVTINSEKQLTTNASSVTGNILNSGTLELTGGSIGSEITGTGTTVINGQVTNSSTVANSVVINSEKQLTTNASNVTGNILNSGTLELTGGTIDNEITGTGTTVINGEVTNNTEIAQTTITVNNSFTNKSVINSTNFYVNGTITNEAQITSNDMYINGIFKIGEAGNFYGTTNSIISDGAEIFLQNDLLQNHNFGNITINSGKMNLFVDADLENKQMDTISADSFNGNGKIHVKAINIIKDSKEEQTEILFTSSTVLKDKITSIDTVSSALYKYNLAYSSETGTFNFINTNKIVPEINPIIAESAVAATVGAVAIQVNIMEQAFASINGKISKVKNSASAKSSKLYASASDQVFEETGKIEKGLWLRPFALQETVKLNGTDVDNTLYGTLAGIDLPVGQDKQISFYLGYAGSKQEYEQIKITQTGYVIGATGMLIKESWYAGLTANVLFNKAEGQSCYGTDDFDMNMYSVGAKAGYNYDINEKLTLEPNLTLMYGNINSKEYETLQGAKIDSQSNSNIIVEPQIKAKLSLINGWQPYVLLGYIANMNDKAKVKANETDFEIDSIDGYVEYGLGVNKEFINSSWNFYAQVTGRNGGRCGFGGNLGIKYKF